MYVCVDLFTYVCMYLCHVYPMCVSNGCNHDLSIHTIPASCVLEWLFRSDAYHNGSTCCIHIAFWHGYIVFLYIISRPKTQGIHLYIHNKKATEPTSHPHGGGAPDMRQASIGTFPADGHRLENHAAGTALRWGCWSSASYHLLTQCRKYSRTKNQDKHRKQHS